MRFSSSTLGLRFFAARRARSADAPGSPAAAGAKSRNWERWKAPTKSPASARAQRRPEPRQAERAEDRQRRRERQNVGFMFRGNQREHKQRRCDPADQKERRGRAQRGFPREISATDFPQRGQEGRADQQQRRNVKHDRSAGMKFLAADQRLHRLVEEEIAPQP